MTINITSPLPVGKCRSKVGNIISAYYRISKPGIHCYTVSIFIHVFVEVVKFHGIVIANAALRSTQVKLPEFHDLWGKPEVGLKFLKLKSRTFYCSKIDVGSDRVFSK